MILNPCCLADLVEAYVVRRHYSPCNKLRMIIFGTGNKVKQCFVGHCALCFDKLSMTHSKLSMTRSKLSMTRARSSA